jgi:hypothetical protein
MNVRSGHLISSGGIWIGAVAWATSTQLNYSLVPWVCASGVRPTPWIAVALAMIALGGALLSWLAFGSRATRIGTETPEAGTPFEMLSIVGVGAGILFAVIIVMQGAASLFLTGCEP